jgi:hypothetical protein
MTRVYLRVGDAALPGSLPPFCHHELTLGASRPYQRRRGIADDTRRHDWSEVMMGRIYSNIPPQVLGKKDLRAISFLSFMEMWRGNEGT